MAWNDGLVDAFPIPIDRLSLMDERVTDISPNREGPFNFLRLPIELRNEVYRLTLFEQAVRRVRTDRAAILRACKQCHEEAARILYSHSVFRIFPKQEFKPLPSVLNVASPYRKWVTTLDMMVGSSWTEPPKSWRMTKTLARRLVRMKAVHTLHVFVEADPSDRMFANFRISETFYTDFCGELLEDVLEVMQQVKTVELDGHSFVDREGPLVARLREECEKQQKTVQWGSQNFATWTGEQINAEVVSIIGKPAMYPR